MSAEIAYGYRTNGVDFLELTDGSVWQKAGDRRCGVCGAPAEANVVHDCQARAPLTAEQQDAVRTLAREEIHRALASGLAVVPFAGQANL